VSPSGPDDRDFASHSAAFGGEDHDFFTDYLPGAHDSAGDDDDIDDLAALDFGPADSGDLDEGVGEPAEEVDADIPLYVVANPEETVTVTTTMDGRIRRIGLSAQAARMAESELAAEIVVVSKLAAQKARAAQYTLLAHQMAQQGYDAGASQDFLTRELNLPTPADAAAAQAKVFASRYAENDD
jgi:hypothetical protein